MGGVTSQAPRAGAASAPGPAAEVPGPDAASAVHAGHSRLQTSGEPSGNATRGASTQEEDSAPEASVRQQRLPRRRGEPKESVPLVKCKEFDLLVRLCHLKPKPMFSFNFCTVRRALLFAPSSIAFGREAEEAGEQN